MSQLTPCPECQRHVRKSETLCPFCDAALSLSHLPDHALPRQRLGRAATFAFGAGVVGATALVSCAGDVVPLYGAAPSAGAASAVYGAPPSGSSNGGSSNADAGAGTAIYGAPAAGAGGEEPQPNGGASGNGGVAGEGGVTDDGGFGGGLIYGAPPGGAGGI
jgi:hypothetical protein